MKLTQISNLSIGLSATPASTVRFSIPLLLVDHADIPIDKRSRTTSRSAYATDLTAATDQYNWCAALWGQNYNPASAYLGRWISSASAAYMVFPDAGTTIATWAALTTSGQMKITEGVTTEDINPDYTGVTSMADVCTATTAGLAASSNFTSYTCTLDAYDRPIITSDNTGASADSVSAGTPDAGTDLTGTSYFGTEFSVPGYDAEALETALAAILGRDNSPFVVCQRGGSIAQEVALSTYVNSQPKLLLLRLTDTNNKDTSETGTTGYQIAALSHRRVHLEYTEWTTQHPDAALIGEVFQMLEGSSNMAHVPLSGLSESGKHIDGTTVIPLTDDERIELEANGCDYLIDVAGSTTFRHGLSAAGANYEIRIMFAKSYMEAMVNTDWYGYMVANDVVTFSDEDINAYKGIVERWYNTLVERKALEAGATITMPSAADFTAAQKASHTMTLLNISAMETQRAVNDLSATLTWGV